MQFNIFKNKPKKQNTTHEIKEVRINVNRIPKNKNKTYYYSLVQYFLKPKDFIVPLHVL